MPRYSFGSKVLDISKYTPKHYMNNGTVYVNGTHTLLEVTNKAGYFGGIRLLASTSPGGTLTAALKITIDGVVYYHKAGQVLTNSSYVRNLEIIVASQDMLKISAYGGNSNEARFSVIRGGLDSIECKNTTLSVIKNKLETDGSTDIETLNMPLMLGYFMIDRIFFNSSLKIEIITTGCTEAIESYAQYGIIE